MEESVIWILTGLNNVAVFRCLPFFRGTFPGWVSRGKSSFSEEDFLSAVTYLSQTKSITKKYSMPSTVESIAVLN